MINISAAHESNTELLFKFNDSSAYSVSRSFVGRIYSDNSSAEIGSIYLQDDDDRARGRNKIYIKSYRDINVVVTKYIAELKEYGFTDVYDYAGLIRLNKAEESIKIVRKGIEYTVLKSDLTFDEFVSYSGDSYILTDDAIKSLKSIDADICYTNKNIVFKNVTYYDTSDNGSFDIPGCSLKVINRSHLRSVGMQTIIEQFFERVTWSNVMSRTFDFKTDHLSEQIRIRYAMMDRPSSGLSNPVLDSFIPRMLYRAKFNTHIAKTYLNAPKTSCCISPWFANMFGLKQIPVEQLCRILGYDRKDIRRLFDDVKKQNKSILFIGYGGTNVNTIHWIDEMAKLTNSINVFNEVFVLEPESAEVSNLLRFPLDPSRVVRHNSEYRFNNKSKLNLLGSQFSTLTKKGIVNAHSMFYSPTDRNATAHNRSYIKAEDGSFLRDENGSTIEEIIAKPNFIIYGAPGISTRHELSKYGNFISATHGDASCRLDLNPAQDAELQVESYGIIQLGTFFMNQLRMAIGFLEVLANPNIDYQAKDVTLLEYSFDGIAKKTTDCSYNFQLNFNGLVLTEAQANQAV